MSSTDSPLTSEVSPEVVEQPRTSRSRRNAQAGPGPSTVASRSSGAVVPHPLSRSHTRSTTGDELPKEERIRQKELELAKIADRHDDMIRELYHMERFVTLIIGFDPSVVKREQSAAFLEYQAPLDLFARFASSSSSSIGVGRLSSRTSRRTLTDQIVKPPPRPLKKALADIPTVVSKSLGKGKSKEESSEVEDPPRLPVSLSENPGKASHRFARKSGNGRDDLPDSTVKRKRFTLMDPPETEEAAPSVPLKKRAPYKAPAIGSRKSGRSRVPPRQSGPPDVEAPAQPNGVNGKVAKRKSSASNLQGVSKRLKATPTPPPGPQPVIKYTHHDHIPIEDVLFEGTVGEFLDSYHVLDEKEVDIKELEAQALAMAKIYARVRVLQSQGRMLDALGPAADGEEDGPAKVAVPGALRAPAEARKLPDHQSHLLSHVLQVGTAMRLEHRNHIFAARKISKAVQAHFEHLEGKEDREKKEIERQKKATMRELVKAIKAKWKLATNVVRARRQAEAKKEQERLGKVHLQSILDRSTGLIEAQRNAMTEGTPQEPESSDEEGEEEDDEDESDDGSEVEEEEEEEEDEENDGSDAAKEGHSGVDSRAINGVKGDIHLDGDGDVAMLFARDDEDGATEDEEPADVTGEPDFETPDAGESPAGLEPVTNGVDSYGNTSQQELVHRALIIPQALNGASPATPSEELAEGKRMKRRKITKRSRRSRSGTSSGNADANDMEFEDEEDVDDQDREMDLAMEEEEGSAESDSEDDGLVADADLPIEELLKRYGYGEDVVRTIAVPTVAPKKLMQDNPPHSEDPDSTFRPTDEEESRVRRSGRERKIRTIRDSYSPIAKPASVPEVSVHNDDDEEEDEEEDDVSVFSDRSNGQGGVQMRPPFLLRGILRPYQHAGLEWLAGLYKNKVNGILADEMGLGKTIQTIALLAHLACDKGVWGPHLIVVPTSVILNWEMEFKKFLPGMKVLTYYGNQKERKERRIGWSTENFFQVCITSYQLVLADQHIFRRKAWKYLILDEAHNIKNFRSQRWQTVLGFRSERRLLLTGTPLQNNLMELWSLMYFLMPHGVSDELTKAGGFANHREFSEWFSNPMEKAVESGEIMTAETRDTIERLHTILRPYMLRRLKSEVETQLPGKFEHVTYCKLSKRQRFLYDEFMSRASTRESLVSGGYLGVANCLMQLRKVCNHPDLFEVRPVRTSFAIEKSVVSDYGDTEYLLRKRLAGEDATDRVSLRVILLSITSQENASALAAYSTRRLDATGLLPYAGKPRTAWPEEDEFATRTLAAWQAREAQLAEQASEKRWSQIRYNNRLRCAGKPLYGNDLLGKLASMSVNYRLMKQDEIERYPRHLLEGHLEPLSSLVLSRSARARALGPIIDKFAVIPPNVVARDLAGQALPSLDITDTPELSSLEFDTLHRSTVKLQIAFPDASLLQYDCGKLQVLHDMLKELKAGGHRVIIFTQMTKMLDILELFLSHQGHRYFRLDGGTKIEERQRITERFNSDDRIFCFIASTRAGGVGINLTGADTVIFYDADYNVAMDRQAMDRAHRIGQTREVHIHRLVTLHTVEENILKKSNQKRMLDNLVIQEGNFTTQYFEKLDLRDMLGEDILNSLKPPPKAVDADENAATPGTPGTNGGRVSETTILDRREMGRAFAEIEDAEDAEAARIAIQEVEMDESEFAGAGRDVRAAGSKSVEPEGTGTPMDVDDGEQGDEAEPGGEDEEEGEAEDEEDDGEGGGVDDYMLRFVEHEWDL